ncbi:MAG: DUF447 family protein [Nitrososphaerota archaeon]|jgi:hypothetical protein|nr:DUF447 family protein [Nitrososphaerota archaeon]
MVVLADLGFSEGMIYEVIVCTYNKDGSSNAAPMGVVMRGSEYIVLTIYNSSSTLRNMQVCRSATLNFTDNLDFFFQAAFKDAVLPMDWFEKSCIVNAPQLKLADATIALSLEDCAVFDVQKTRVTGKIQHIAALNVYPKGYCRAKAAVLEAIVHATRVKALIGNEKEQNYLVKLLVLIQNCYEIVNRCAPNSYYAELMSDLQKKIDMWSHFKHESLR